MPEKVRITVRASEAHPDVLTVQDAMLQVSDFFELLESNTDGEAVAWRLSYASTNSPFVVEGEATSLRPGIDITVIARAAKADFWNGMSLLSKGIEPSSWRGTEKEKIVGRIVARNQNGIGVTDIQIDAEPAITLRPESLRTLAHDLAVRLLPPSHDEALFGGDHSRTEQGSLEGEIAYVGTYYTHPAIKLRERRSRTEIWCRISDNIAEQIAEQADFNDIWQHHRVLVKGAITYRSDGGIAGVTAKSIQRVAPKKVLVSDIRDPNFTSGHSITDYLEKFREGELG